MKKIVVLFLFYFIFIQIAYASEKVELSNIECIDGDTFRAEIKGKKETIRLLAVDTPETKYATKLADEPYAIEASEYTCSMLTNSKEILLEYDSKSKITDKYGRVLGWVYADDVFLQKELISKGYAKIEYVYDNYKYIDELKKEEKLAKKNKIGIWNEGENKTEEDEEEKSLFDKIIDFLIDKIKELFEHIFKSIKNNIDKESKN